MNKRACPSNNSHHAEQQSQPSQSQRTYRNPPSPTRRFPSTPPSFLRARASEASSTVSLGTSASANSTAGSNSNSNTANSFNSPDRKHQNQHRRDPSNFSLTGELLPWNSPYTPRNSKFFVEEEAFSLLSYPSPERKKQTRSSVPPSPSTSSYESIFPYPSLKSPNKKPQTPNNRRREKNVSFGFLEHPVDLEALPPFSPFPSHPLRKIPEWGDEEDTGSIVKVQQPKTVSPVRSSHRGYSYPPPPTHYPFRHLKRKPFTMQDTRSQETHKDDPKSSGHVITTDSHGVEVVYKEEGNTNGTKKNDTPPREKNSESDKKLNVISPPEGQSHGHNRSPSYNPTDYGELPSVPDSPYSPYQPIYSNAWAAPTNSPVRSHRTPKRSSEDNQQGQYPPYSPYYGGYHHYAPPGGYEDGYRKMSSPGKRQRVGTSDDHHLSKEREAADHFLVDPGDRYYHPDPYQQQRAAFYPPEKRDLYSESFDSGDERKYVSPPPPVAKASSYPPPPSPRYDDSAAESSANSYPGARRPTASEYGGYGHPLYHPRHVPHPYDYYEHGYYQDSRPHGRYHAPPSAPRPTHPSYYYPEGQPPRDDAHPLLRDYDPDRDRRMTQHADEASKHFSPDRSTTKADGESVATTPSLKSKSSKSASPRKTKPSATAQAAIRAGMTQPASASEIDFDIHNPPLEPVIPPSTEPVCTVTSNVANNDVLCGRGGGTNTQIGNRKFRALVQEFQPTYLLCRRKEKPLIARTIVLIIRNRGGRFLKKDEGNGMLFEVGDEKAEAKTSQALREGLDVRASKQTTLEGRKKLRQRKKEGAAPVKLETSQAADVTMAESPSRPQRDGPPPQHEYSHPVHPYPPPHYYYGYGSQYPSYPYGYEPNPAHASPSRKRPRGPEFDPTYYPQHPYPKGHYHPYPQHGGYDYHYEGYAPATSHSQAGEENSMWEVEFNPPRGPIKKEVKGEQ